MKALSVKARIHPVPDLRMFIVLLLLSISEANACRCRTMTLQEEITNADDIFTGTVIKKATGNDISYIFAISTRFKGNKKDTIIIHSGFGGPDCGMVFETGKSYLVYSKNGQTNRCRRNGPAAHHPDIRQLHAIFLQHNTQWHQNTTTLIFRTKYSGSSLWEPQTMPPDETVFLYSQSKNNLRFLKEPRWYRISVWNFSPC